MLPLSSEADISETLWGFRPQMAWETPVSGGQGGKSESLLAHQNRTIAIASDFRVDGAKSPEIPEKERGFGLRNRSPKS